MRQDPLSDPAQKSGPHLPRAAKRAIWVGLLGLWAEKLLQAFWAFGVAAMLFAAIWQLAMGIDPNSPYATAIVYTGFPILALFALWGARRFHRPRYSEVLARLDKPLFGGPFAALHDTPHVAQEERASQLWQEHLAQMRVRASNARFVWPDLRLSARDPFALRYVALWLFLAVYWYVPPLTPQTNGVSAKQDAMIAGGVLWEGWLEPPAYTAAPTQYLDDLPRDRASAFLHGTKLILRYYDKEAGAALVQDIDPEGPQQEADDLNLKLRRSGVLQPDTQTQFAFSVLSDQVPSAQILSDAEASIKGPTRFRYRASDDFGITSGRVEIMLDLDAVDRRYGLAVAPDPRDVIIRDLSLPLSGSRTAFDAEFADLFQKHPWANLPVLVIVHVADAAGHQGQTAPRAMRLATPGFFDPVAAAIIEQRQALLWSVANARDVAQMLRALSYEAQALFPSAVTYLRLRHIIRQLENALELGHVEARQAPLAEALWGLAVKLETGDIDQALARLQAAQDRLNQAMRSGASDTEIAKLMQELRQATDDYMRQLSRQAQLDAEERGSDFVQGQNDGLDAESLRFSQQDLQAMMDKIQELMEQGRMAEAQQALEEYNELLRNMEIARQQGQGFGSPSEQALEGLSQMLRDQQSLADDAFRNLQNQQNQQAGPGGERRQQPGVRAPNQGVGAQGLGEQLAERQRALERELQRQRRDGALENAGPDGDAQGALDRAEQAMRRAAEALGQEALAEALRQQSEAIDALRDGINELGNALAERGNPGRDTRPGEAPGQGAQSSPLGQTLSQGQTGQEGDQALNTGPMPNEDQIIDEIRRRQGDQARSERERAYLRRLLDLGLSEPQ